MIEQRANHSVSNYDLSKTTESKCPIKIAREAILQ